jgi:Transposase DDE domain group 1
VKFPRATRLPLYVFCGRHLLAAKLRRSNIDASAGAVEEIARIVARIRRRWPRTRILLRGDSGFAREALMAWCETNRVDFLFGLARNERLEAAIKPELMLASLDSMRSGRPARRFRDFMWSTIDSWSHNRRVVGKAEVTGGEANPRFVVTSLKQSEIGAQRLYEAIYCARGEMENRIKECQLDLFADRTSAATMRANQLRLWFASMAYVLLCALRRIGLAHSQFADATCGTIRLKLLKIGALVRVSVRRIKCHLPVPGRTNSPSLMCDCDMLPPNTNQTSHSQHTSQNAAGLAVLLMRDPTLATTSARPFLPYRRLRPTRRALPLRQYENSGSGRAARRTESQPLDVVCVPPDRRIGAE